MVKLIIRLEPVEHNLFICTCQATNNSTTILVLETFFTSTVLLGDLFIDTSGDLCQEAAPDKSQGRDVILHRMCSLMTRIRLHNLHTLCHLSEI